MNCSDAIVHLVNGSFRLFQVLETKCSSLWNKVFKPMKQSVFLNETLCFAIANKVFNRMNKPFD